MCMMAIRVIYSTECPPEVLSSSTAQAALANNNSLDLCLIARLACPSSPDSGLRIWTVLNLASITSYFEHVPEAVKGKQEE